MGEKIRIGLKSTLTDDLFKSTQENIGANTNYIDINKLDMFPEHPFKLYTGKRLDNLIESIKKLGIVTPLSLRKKEDGRFEILSGHNRHNAARLIGLKEVPYVLLDVDNDTAKLIVVDSNFRQRDELLPSEKAFGYKMKLQALKHRGQRTDLIDPAESSSKKSRDVIGEEIGDSGIQVQRYVRLTELIQELLDCVDEKVIGFTAGVELSYLDKNDQMLLYEIAQEEKLKIKISHAAKLKKLCQEKELTAEDIIEVLTYSNEKKEHVKIQSDFIKQYFQAGTSHADIMSTITKALEMYKGNTRKE